MSASSDLLKGLFPVTSFEVCFWWPLSRSVSGDLFRGLFLVASFEVLFPVTLSRFVSGDLFQGLFPVTFKVCSGDLQSLFR